MSPVLLAGSLFGQNQLHLWTFRSGPASSFKVSTRSSLFTRAFSVRIGLIHKIALFWIGCIRKKVLVTRGAFVFEGDDSETTQHGNKTVAQRKYFAVTMNAKTNEGAPFY